MLKNVFKYMNEHKRSYFFVVIFFVINYAIIILPTKIIQKIIDGISSNTLQPVELIKLLILFLVISVICYISESAWVYLLYSEQSRFQYMYRKNLFSKILNMRTPYYEKFTSGDMLTFFTTDIINLSELLGYSFMGILQLLSTIIVVLPTMFLISFKLTIFLIIPIIIWGIVSGVVGEGYEKTFEINRQSVSELNTYVLEIVEGTRVIRSYSRNDSILEKFKNKTKAVFKNSNRFSYYNSAYFSMSVFFLSFSTLISIYFGAIDVSKGIITLGELIALNLYTNLLIDPMWATSDLIYTIKTSKVSNKKLDNALAESDGIIDGNLEIKSFKNIEFKDYSFQYAKSEFKNLDRINLKIEKGKTIGIVGKTGSGKSTLVKQFLRQYPMGNGEILVNGINLREYELSSFENLVSYVPQDYILFSKSIYDNITFGDKNYSKNDVMNAIKNASFIKDIENLNNGLETLIGENGVSISGGQKQRISIARAFLKDSEILILDDSLSAVDAKTEREIIENIKLLRKDKTNIIVTHRLSAVNHADYIIVLDNGKIIEEGTPFELLNKEGWYFEQYNKQKLEVED